MRRKILFISGVVLLLGAAVAMYYFSAGEEASLMLDKTSFREVVDELPGTEKEAALASEKVILEYYNTSEKVFQRFFALANATKTRYKWEVVYEVRDNPLVKVQLVKKITPEEGYSITDAYIKGKVGEEYFKKHYSRKSFTGSTARYTFTITGSGPYKMEMWIRLSDDRKIVKKHVLLEPQEVRVKAEEAEKKAIAQGVPGPVAVNLIFDGSRLVWRATWKHKATKEDREAQRVYGADVDAEKGNVVRLHRYAKPVKKPAEEGLPRITKVQVDSLAKKTKEFMELKDGAVINVRISKSHSETYTIVKSLGRIVVRDGLSKEPDITIWIERDAFLGALKSDDPMGHLLQESKKGKVTIDEEKNPLTLAKKGYVKLYDRVKNG
jgi:hypothetical protein